SRMRAVLRLHKPGELLVEARQAAAAVHQLLLAAGPGRMRGGVDVQRDLLARRAIGGARLVGRAVVQRDLDEVIIRVDTLFHDAEPFRSRAPISDGPRKARLIREQFLKNNSGFPSSCPPYIQPDHPLEPPALARDDTDFSKETARIAAGRPRSRSLAPLRGVLPFLRPYRGRIALAALALLCSSAATLVLPLLAGGLIDARGLSQAQAHALTGFYFAFVAAAAVLALASATRFYAVTWLGERVVADIR